MWGRGGEDEWGFRIAGNRSGRAGKCSRWCIPGQRARLAERAAHTRTRRRPRIFPSRPAWQATMPSHQPSMHRLPSAGGCARLEWQPATTVLFLPPENCHRCPCVGDLLPHLVSFLPRTLPAQAHAVGAAAESGLDQGCGGCALDGPPAFGSVSGGVFLRQQRLQLHICVLWQQPAGCKSRDKTGCRPRWPGALGT